MPKAIARDGVPPLEIGTWTITSPSDPALLRFSSWPPYERAGPLTFRSVLSVARKSAEGPRGWYILCRRLGSFPGGHLDIHFWPTGRVWPRWAAFLAAVLAIRESRPTGTEPTRFRCRLTWVGSLLL